MQHIAPILQATASLAWPIFALIAVFMFKSEIAELIRAIPESLRRIKKAEVGALKLELDTLDKVVAPLEKEAQELPPEERRLAGPGQEETFDAIRQAIFQQATSAPKVALMTLRAELEKQAQQALATRGLLRGRPVVSLNQALGELRQYGLPELEASQKLFDDVRNKLVHGAAGTDDDALRALDSGITILRALNALPNEVNVVHNPRVEIFSDGMCTTPIPDAKGVILESTPPGGGMKTFRIFPTTRIHFQKGKRVAWEWNMQKVWPAAWYRDPDTGTITQAWDQAAEFIGRHLDEIF